MAKFIFYIVADLILIGFCIWSLTQETPADWWLNWVIGIILIVNIVSLVVDVYNLCGEVWL